ncbi:MAG: hypothetical protein IPM98_10730 [Lewinellaceae bacterium]|nr:hypothetical protein [Lewinellaceae bacterium]
MFIPVQLLSENSLKEVKAFLSQLNQTSFTGMKKTLLFLIFCFHLTTGALGQETDDARQVIEEARRLAVSGRHLESEALYNRILNQNPDNVDALVGAGYNYSWWKQYNKARISFETALSIHSNAAEALIGQGYNYAWSGNFEMAKRVFEHLKNLAPDNPEAIKGMGYVHLWQGNGAEAEPYFWNLATKYPRETEYRIALAHTYLVRHEVKNARIALQSALQIDSTNRTAAELLQSTYGIAAPLELDVWAGYSITAGESRFSLCSIQLGSQFGRKLRMYLKYDNSLTSDLAAFVRANQEAQALSLGGVWGWNKHHTTRLEFGVRILPEQVTQQIFSGEQVLFFTNGMLLKVGGFYGWSDKMASEWLGYSGIRIPLNRWYAVEPFYFRSRVEDAPQAENRFMLNNQFRTTKGYELNLGLFYGKAGVDADAPSDRILGSYVTAILPLSQSIWGQVSWRWEDAPYYDLTVLAAGIKLRLEK